VDFQEHTDTDMETKIKNKSLSKIKEFIIQHADFNLNAEICGFIGFDTNEKTYVAHIEKNLAKNVSDYFLIDPNNYLKFKNDYDIIAIFHSHIVGDESFSEFDIKMSELSCVPFLVFSLNTRKFNLYEPQNKDYNVKRTINFKEKYDNN
jgi:proteasome lid subunit RPN8/RPN11